LGSQADKEALGLRTKLSETEGCPNRAALFYCLVNNQENKMKTKNQEDKYTRENYARTSQEVPLFPFRPVRMPHIEMDDLEQAQFDFVQQAGLPSNPPTNSKEEDK
jgi:hypothetical protein